MPRITIQKNLILAVVITGILTATSSALAEKPSWAGEGKSGKHQQQERNDRDGSRNDGSSRDHRGDAKGHKEKHSRDHRGDGRSANYHFDDHHRNVIHGYYAERRHSRHCPPGLKKKKNGCMPPGHAKRWKVGRPLPRDVIFYDLPPTVVVQLGPPPARHRFVRVAADILLIAVGTGMVVDAIDDLSGN
jgi:Ni/Co efflux regulator RcnB